MAWIRLKFPQNVLKAIGWTATPPISLQVLASNEYSMSEQRSNVTDNSSGDADCMIQLSSAVLRLTL